MPKIYRIVEYDGAENWLAYQLDRLMPLGRRTFSGEVTISIAVIDPADKISVKIARNKIMQQIARLEQESS